MGSKYVSESTPLPVATHADDLIHSDPSSCPSALPALQRLDSLLERAVEAAGESYGPDAAADPFRGLYVSPAQAARSLAGSVTPANSALSCCQLSSSSLS